MIDQLPILIAEDNEDDVLLLTAALDRLGGRYAVVADGQQALAYLRREGAFRDAPRPRLVVLDLNMPRRGGFEVLAEMRLDPDLRAIPVVVLTSSSRQADEVRSYLGGASAFLTKPSGAAGFLDVARQLVGPPRPMEDDLPASERVSIEETR